MTGLIVLSVITVYLALAAAAAPKLMRLVYRDNLAVLAEDEAIWKEKQEHHRKHGGPPPFRHSESTDLEAMHEARRFGYWLALVWPISLSFYQFGDNAFKQEIAALQAKQNTKVIADYEKLLAEKFDKELASANPPTLIRRLTRKAQK